jgi:hypothetical protein
MPARAACSCPRKPPPAACCIERRARLQRPALAAGRASADDLAGPGRPRQLAGRLSFQARTLGHTRTATSSMLDWLPATDADPRAPLLALFHGLEGSTASHYAQAFADSRRAGAAGVFVMPHFRGCSGELNRAPRAYHSGDHAEIGWCSGQAEAARHAGPVLAVGVSLGGNALMRWAGESRVMPRRRRGPWPRSARRWTWRRRPRHRPRLQPAGSTRACSCAR